MDNEKLLPHQILTETIGISIKMLTNDFKELPGYEGSVNSYQEIVFQVNEEDPDLYAINVLFTLSLMSFTFAAPRGLSEMYFVPDDEWDLGYFLRGLEFQHKRLYFSSDYVSGRLMKTDITFEPGGKVTLTTRNRGRGAERWLLHLQGEKHIKAIKK